MRLWKRAAGVLKDKNSIWISSISRRTPYRNPDLEAVIIKSTSHDESFIDYKNAQRVFQWVRTSPIYLKPLIWALSMRLNKTRSWVVALKGLLLMHGVFCCKVPAVQLIGRLPFDLSSFSDGHSKPTKTWGFNVFIRAYYLFLDQKSALLAAEMKQQRGRMIRQTEEQQPLVEELEKSQKWQSLLDMLLQIKPQAENMIVPLILEAMKCAVIEIFGVYSRICKGLAQVLLMIYEAGGKVEAELALKVLQKASVQGEELSLYLELCRNIGVLNATECPRVEPIPEEDFRDLERIINGVSENKNSLDDNVMAAPDEESGAINVEWKKSSERILKTIITDKWEVFEEDIPMFINGGVMNFSDVRRTNARGNPFAASLNLLPIVPASSNHVIPDLITFY